MESKKEEPIIIYEVIRIFGDRKIKNDEYHKMCLFLKEHLERMQNSFKIIGKEMPLTFEQINKEIDNLIKSKEDKTGNIKLCFDVTKGKGEFSLFYIPHSYPTENMYKEGVKTIFHHAERENPNAKIIHEDLRKVANEKIKATNSYEAILVDHNGNITEGSKSNIFMIKDGILMTSPADNVLQGITRMKIIEVAKKLNIKFQEVPINFKEVDKLDAMFISGTSPKVLPIKLVEDIKLNVNNDIMKKIMDGYDQMIIDDGK